jgi:putative membrane protein
MNLERVNSTPARWWTLLGLVLVPLLIAGGFLVAGLNTDNRLHNVQAAVVNLDEPVTVHGQYAPMGRQLTANLVDSQRVENLTWVLDSEANARAGLNTGAYAAMVVIPKNFSAAATSYGGDAKDAERATIELSTSPVAGVADATLSKAVAMEAATALNESLTSTYLDNIYVGFNDMGKQFTTMSDGASQLSSGTSDLAAGIQQAADGSSKLASGTTALADGLGQLKTQTATMPSATTKLADGTTQYVAGVNALIDQTIDALPAQVQLADGVKQLSDGASGLSTGLGTYQDSMEDLGSNATVVGQATVAAEAAVAPTPCPTFSADPTVQATACAAFKAGLTAGADAGAAVGVTVGGKAAAAGLDTADPSTGQSLMTGAAGLASGLSTLSSQLQASLPDVATTTAQLKKLKAGGNQLDDGISQLADGMPALVDGIAQSADGAAELATGTSAMSTGLVSAARGAGTLSSGMADFAAGIAKGQDKIPSYTTSDRENLASVVSAPVSTDGLTGLANPDLGWVSLLLILALWLGALATYTVVKAVARGLLGSADTTPKLIAEALLPGVALVSVQAVLLGGLAAWAWDLNWQKTLTVSVVLLIAGVTFAVINHALVTWAGGFGRLISVVFAVIATAATLAPAAPGVLEALRPFSPLTPALDAVRAVLTESDAAASSTFIVIGWLLIGLLASAIGIARQRTTSLAAIIAV